ncbi:MAG: DUF6777 domain-containing protein, partial [Acidimicrobiales bacterium]
AALLVALDAVPTPVERPPLAETIGPEAMAAARGDAPVVAGPPPAPSGPPRAPAALPPTTAPRARRNRRRERNLIGGTALVGLVAILVALITAGGKGGGGGVSGQDTQRAARSIVLIGAAFSAKEPWTTTEAIAEPIPARPPTPGSAGRDRTTVSVTAVSGATPGLYGQRGEPACDVDRLVAALARPEVAAPWLVVAGAGGAVEGFLDGLTDVVLTSDTRVTGYWRRATGGAKFQSVLQAGTPVLVDSSGVPRVRCAGGYPLAPPEPAQAKPDYVGDAWAGFDPEAMTVVVGRETVSVFQLTDLATGDLVSRPAGRRAPG